jgi:two-component system chemotaxis sensor kinase CheA
MPLAPLVEGYGAAAGEAAEQAVLVFGDNGRALGLMVDAILDVVQARLTLDRAGQRPGFLGSLVVDGKVTEVIDTAWWLRNASDGDGNEWFGGGQAGAGQPPRILVVEDSRFFRDLVIPALTAAGYAVLAAADGEAALRLRDAGEAFDAIISDINMPGMDGFALASAIRRGGAWCELPLIALSGRRTPADLARGRAAGFTDYVGKYDPAALLDSLRQCLEAAPVVERSAA